MSSIILYKTSSYFHYSCNPNKPNRKKIFIFIANGAYKLTYDGGPT